MPDEKPRKSISIRFVVIALTGILGAQMAASYALAVSERPAAKLGLELLPAKIGRWDLAAEHPLEEEVVAYLRPDDYIQRDYVTAGEAVPMNLFVAYFKSLQNEYGPHSPRACLPGSGWLVHDWRIVNLPVAGKPEGIPVNKYWLEKNGQSILVVYWYQNDRRAWAEEYEFKLHLLPDLLRFHKSDVSLVRIVTPVANDASLDEPFKNASEFASTVYAQLLERFTQAQ